MAIVSPDRFTLTVKEGPEPGLEYPLSAPEITIGRDAQVNFQISSPAVSRRHARLVRQDKNYFLEDLGSSNGTFLNGKRIAERVQLSSGDRIRLGQVITLVFSLAQPDFVEQPVDPYGQGLNETVIGEVTGFQKQVLPPQLVVSVTGADPKVYTLIKDQYSIGRAEENDIIIPSQVVSRNHAHLDRVDGSYRLTVLPQASNPILFEGRPLKEPRLLSHSDTLRIGSLDPGMMVTLTFASPEEAFKEETQSIEFGEKTKIQIGRDPVNDVILDHPKVSRFHAQVERVGQRYRVWDLRSSNGTFVNDQRITGEVWLRPDDKIRIGPYRFVMGQDELAQYSETKGLKVDAIGLNKWVRKDLNILKDISVNFQPREFIVVVGQSGGGKSTLVDAIAGYRPATHGRVLVNDIDVYQNFDAIRSDIGFVPQKDIIHMELTVFQALDYAAQLRMPPDTTKEERYQRVMEVLDDLDLAHRKDVQISGLSGGQQKRVSIGVELLTKPGLFFLDEPTSGLDPGTETALMQLMRRLADQGRTIVLITHATKNVMLADKVIFLARGGYLAWFGPPDEALKYFNEFRSVRDRRAGEMEFDEIYAILDDPSKGSPEEWAKRFREHSAYQKFILQPMEEKMDLASGSIPRPVRKEKTSSQRQVSSLRQFFILSARNVKILTRDRFGLLLMLAAAPLVSLLDVILSLVLGSDPFDPVDGSMTNVIITLFLLTIYGVMVGGIAQMREIVKEQDIYKRERLVNLKIVPYVLSKVWVAALLALYQSAVYVIVHYLVFDMPGSMFDFLLVYGTMALATMAGMMLGLFASALAPNANTAPLLVILLMLPQIVLGGALIPLPRLISAPTATHWAFGALMGISGIGSDVAADVCWAFPEETRKAMTLEQKEAAGCRCLGISILDPDSCAYPGLGKFYNPEIEEPAPVAPAQLGEPPTEPVIPARPVEPQNQSDTVAMAEFFEQLKAWETQVTQLQADYKASLEAYQIQADIFKAEAVAYQEALARWQIARASSVEPSESLVNQVREEYGWTFANKEDSPAYLSKIGKAWFAEGMIISILLVAILFLQKRKDIV
jgi:ABC transport system ATP-binding/permease protein